MSTTPPLHPPRRRLLALRVAMLAMACAFAGWPAIYGQFSGWKDKASAALCIGGAVILAMAQRSLGIQARHLRSLVQRQEDEHSEAQALRRQLEGTSRERDALRQQVERLAGERELAHAAQAHDSFDAFLGELAAVANDIAGARELSVYLLDKEQVPYPAAFCQIGESCQLFIDFTPEGGKLLASEAKGGAVSPGRLGMRKLSLDLQSSRALATAELGLALGGRTHQPLGTVRLVLGLEDPDEPFTRDDASSRMRAELARLTLDLSNVAEALSSRLPRRFDSARGRLDISCPARTSTEVAGILKASFSTSGVDMNSRLPEWEQLLERAGRHLAAALRSERFQQRAIKDSLTGLFNKAYFSEKLPELCAVARAEGTLLSLIMVDIDKFKAVNDTYGHVTGDIILKGVAAVLASSARQGDVAYRFGGEEMGFILPGTDIRSALAMANRVRKKVESTEHTGEKGETVRVTISLGVSEYTPDVDEPGKLLSRADEALYHSKHNGRNQATAWGSKAMLAAAKAAIEAKSAAVAPAPAAEVKQPESSEPTA